MNEIKNIDALTDMLRREEEKGRVAVMTVEGIMSYDIEEFCSQPAELLLYDLNRDTATTLTLLKKGKDSLPLVRLINDYAAALVIRHLKSKINNQ